MPVVRTFRNKNIKEWRGSTEEITNRVAKGRVAIKKLNALIWSTSITKQIKRRLYKSNVESTALHGSEVCEVSEKNKNGDGLLAMKLWVNTHG